MHLSALLVAASLAASPVTNLLAEHNDDEGPPRSDTTQVSPLPGTGLWVGQIGPNRMAIEILEAESGPEVVLYVLDNEARAFAASAVEASENAVAASFGDLGATLRARTMDQTLEVTWVQVGRELSAAFRPSEPLDAIVRRKAAMEKGVAPTAPLATEQFAFLVGEWHGTTKRRGEDGEYVETGSIVWKGEWLLGGTAVQNTSQSRDLQGRIVQHGLDTRIFSAGLGEWQHQYADAFTGEFLALTWTLQDDVLVSSPTEWMGPDGEMALHIIRIRVEAPDRFVWTADMSKDGGATWTDAFLRQDNVRVR